ncbi:chaperone protein dnaJ 11, chloroplastic-like [Phragmites australis]|uniref:chaperone protein dnaJ 11, chloroplastic-like n=1 Tax=Phragmites australis TaxID=29695 RepID=UPI002D7914AB|nr:chaperone protein dnaJ 11, chloroplastic-like [Phragmites australis]
MAGAVPLAAPAVMATGGSLYEALRVGRAATQVEIKAAYRAMAKRLHPDSSRAREGTGGSGAAAFLEIRRAYETLSDPAERARYDRSLGACWRPGGGSSVATMRVRRWETDQCW